MRFELPAALLARLPRPVPTPDLAEQAALSGVPLAVLQAATTWDVPAGRRLLSGGPVGDVCFGLRTGMTLLLHPDEEHETLVDVLEPGQWIGVDEGPQGQRVGFAAETASRASLWVLRRNHLHALVESHAEVREWQLQCAWARAQRIGERLHVLSACDVEHRVEWALGLVNARFARSETPGGDRRVCFRVKQGELARIAGCSRQSVNRVMVKMEREHKLRIEQGRIIFSARRARTP